MKNRECKVMLRELTSRDSSDNRLTEKLGRIWDEYPNGLLEVTEAKLSQLDPAGRAVEEQEEHEMEDEEVDRSKPMPYHEMQRLREGLADQLKWVLHPHATHFRTKAKTYQYCSQ